MEISNKKKIVDLLKSLETGNPRSLGYINPGKYIQHNLSAADGLEGLEAFVAVLPPGSTKVNTVRIFQDGDYVFTHNEYEIFGPKIGFDIFRFEDGHVVEHWDNLQETAGPNPGGHTMIDGAREIRDLDKTASNKLLVKSMVGDIFVNGKLEKLPDYFHGDNYIQHNPLIPDKISGLIDAINEWANQGITFQYEIIHKVLGEGDFVLVVGEGQLGGNTNAFYDLFRVENGKIAEHWDVIEEIPPKENWRNNNGKF